MKKQDQSDFGLGGRFDRTLTESVSPLFKENSDEYWMEQALLLSMNSMGICHPNPAVGCVIVNEGKLIGSGFTQAFQKEHAERMAFQSLEINTSLKNATAYVTLEPCSHFGSQPPCVDLFLSSGIKRVVIAVQDPDERVNGEGIRKLLAAGVEVKLHVLEEECKLFNFPFLLNKKTKKPIWIGKWAQTEKGYLADRHGNSKWITNAESRAYTHWLRQKYDLIVLGAETYLKDHPELTVRDCARPWNRNPIRVVFDPKGKLIQTGTPVREDFKVFVCESTLKDFSAIPQSVLSIEGSPDSKELIHRFQAAVKSADFGRTVQSVMVEGGPALLRSFLRDESFDALHIFVGQTEFKENDERYRISFEPDRNWRSASLHSFGHDYLREWVKGF